MNVETPDLGAILLLAIVSLVSLFIGWKRDLFSLPSPVPFSSIHLRQILIAFAIYFAVSSFLTPLLRPLFFYPNDPNPFLTQASWLNFLNSFLILLLLSPFFLNSLLRKSLLHRQGGNGLQLAVFAWIISFPVVLFLNQLSDWFLSTVLHIGQLPDQLAVYFLKMTFGYPLYFILTMITIIFFAPMIEETLFRGFLQSFIRTHLGSKQAIWITSLLFSLFHYSPEQKMANLTIVTSLFAFSLFLGLVYEKRGLFASMTLHALFNGINVANLYFLGGTPKYLFYAGSPL